jgi:hypothetical protein
VTALSFLMSETEEPGRSEEDLRDVPSEQADESGGDARDPARQAGGEAAEEEGAPREGEERTATGNPDAAGAEEEAS